MSKHQVCSCGQTEDPRTRELTEWIAAHRDEPGVALPALQKAQEIYGFLPVEAQRIVAGELGKPLSEIYGIATFYSMFSLTPKGRNHISVCLGTACYVKGGGHIYELLQQKLGIEGGGCLGLCGSGPNVIIFPEGTIYSHVQNEDAARIVSEHLLKGGRVEDLLYDENQATGAVRCLEETDFFQKQTRIALRNCGVIDPQSIEEYIARDGYAALYKALTEMTPVGVIETVLNSGLRGRGGAGVSVGRD